MTCPLSIQVFWDGERPRNYVPSILAHPTGKQANSNACHRTKPRPPPRRDRQRAHDRWPAEGGEKHIKRHIWDSPAVGFLSDSQQELGKVKDLVAYYFRRFFEDHKLSLSDTYNIEIVGPVYYQLKIKSYVFCQSQRSSSETPPAKFLLKNSE